MKRNFKENSSRVNLIDRQINSIFSAISSTLDTRLVATKTKPSKGSVYCKGLIQIYKKADLEQAEENRRKYVSPLESYAFYINNFEQQKLESVAIYCDDPFTKYLILKRRGVLFGLKIVGLKIESGRRPFVDVKLRA